MSFEQAVVNLEQTNAKLQEEVVRFRDAAMGLNNIYPTITEGRQNTDDGKYFSVPGNGAYMRLYRRQGATAELIAEFPDRDELNSLISQLGPLLGRGVVGGSGDLMAQGFAGLGGSGETLNDFLNPERKSHFYAGSGGGATGSVGDQAYWPGIVAYRSSSDRISMLSLTGSGLVQRNATGAAWESPRFVYDNKNSNGIVSHDGTENTGSLFETGSGDDGRYRMWADGSMEFISNILTLTQVTSSALSINLVFPKAFSGLSPVALSLTQHTSSSSYIGNVTLNSIGGVFRDNTSFPTTQTSVGVFRVHGAPGWTSGDEMRNVIIKASGRWRA
ncbi:hypothetical protein ACQKFL_11530 [Vreelandella titanicae]|uniref:hypothetical protein n=1 Tax=Vreelandella titanicae TaxID=664683 RepID=UPI003CFCBE96